ncbi:MAG: chorion class high-cysteine HCB protein 13 [Clostridiales bacterium]|nr:chorion class high-cysteine HCB protein 13 [Clostridiales bacterium]
MSELSANSCFMGKGNDCGNNSMLLIILLLCLCGGDNGIFGGFGGKNDCGCGNGLDGILPIILILCLCGGF